MVQGNYNIQCRYASSLGYGFEQHPNNVWKTTDYIDKTKPCVFCGLYDARDYLALWRHKGLAWVFWCGGDINNLINGFVLNDGKLRWISKMPFFKPYLLRLLKKAVHWVENITEYKALKQLNIESKIAPSFLGNVKDFKVSFKQGNKVYLSCSGDNFKLYKWDLIEEIAGEVPEVIFYLYGNTKEWKTKHKNVIVKGRTDKEIMNQEISKMQAGLRLLDFDGASEIVLKSALWGHHTISKIAYPFVDMYETKTDLINLLKDLPNKTEPNLKAREWFLNNINVYPWNNNHANRNL